VHIARQVGQFYRVAHMIGKIDMNANQDILQGQWPDLKAQAKLRWGKLTDIDVLRLSGKLEELVNLLRRRYGYGKVQAEIEIDKWVHGYDQAHLEVLKGVNGKR
jgi:uncharacterized protein YjbJ (UPF0337 family)